MYDDVICAHVSLCTAYNVSAYNLTNTYKNSNSKPEGLFLIGSWFRIEYIGLSLTLALVDPEKD